MREGTAAALDVWFKALVTMLIAGSCTWMFAELIYKFGYLSGVLSCK